MMSSPGSARRRNSMFMTLRDRLPILLAVAIGVLVVAPTLAGSHWQLLDDGVTLTMAEHLQHDWDIGPSDTGRYFPAHFWFYGLQYRLFGTNIDAYYRVRALLFVASNLFLFGIVRRLTSKPWLALLAVALLASASPVVENYYTLSKAEPLLTLLLLASLYAVVRADLAATPAADASEQPRAASRVGWWAASGCFLFVAYLVQEKAFLVLVASAAWVAVSGALIALRRSTADRIKVAAGYLAVNVLCLALFVLVAYVIVGTPAPWAGTYTGTNVGAALPLVGILRYLKAAGDVTVTLGVASICALVALWRRGHERVASYALFCTLSAGIALGFYAMIWRAQALYYLLPVAAWLAIAVALLVKVLFVDVPASKGVRVSAVALAVVLLGTRFYSIPVAYNSGAGLRTWDQANGAMFEWLSGVPAGSEVFFSYPRDFEYNFQSQLLLKLLDGRTDIRFGSTTDLETFVRTADPGDFLVLHFGGPGNGAAPVRAIAPPLLTALRGSLDAHLAGMQLHRVFGEERDVLTVAPIVLKPGRLALGWLAYRIERAPDAALMAGEDGWMGREARLVVAGSGAATVTLTGASNLPAAALYPLEVTASIDGAVIARRRVERPGPVEFSVDVVPKAGARFSSLRLAADKAIVPAAAGLGADRRELSVLWTRLDVRRVGGSNPTAHPVAAVVPSAAVQPAGPMLDDFACAIDVRDLPARLKVGTDGSGAVVRVTNRSTASWTALLAGRPVLGSVNLAYRWWHGSEMVVEGRRSYLPTNLGPGESASAPLALSAPAAPGRYRLTVEPVQEGVAWFGDRGGCRFESTVEVTR